MMALTATAARTLQRQVTKALGMKHPYTISVPPNQPNIMYVVTQFESVGNSFQQIAQKLYLMQISMGRIIIFCQRYDDCAKIYLNMHYETISHSQMMFLICQSTARLVDMFTACTEQTVKNRCPSSPL